MRSILFAMTLAAVSSVTPVAAAGTGPTLILRVDRSAVHAGDVVNVTLENTGDAPLVISYPGGSNGCAVPSFEAYLVDAHRTPVELASWDGPCTMAIVGPGAIEVPAHSKQVLMQIDTRSIPLAGRLAHGKRALPAGTYQVHMRLSRGFLSTGYTPASFTLT